ncbi:trigger factor [Orrella sp. 11846]|uniref:trigger factor n=1 Tax=Orrella sp. 11846 TaxID=3409913 RepID=UPI003B5B44D1
MQPEVETLTGLERRIEVTVQMADVEKQVSQELKQVARTAKAPGFRPGKVPMSMLERSHGPGIRYDVINQLVGEAIGDALDKTGLRIAGAPSVEPKTEDVADDVLSFLATFEIYPDVEVPELGELEITQTTCEVGDEAIEKTIDILREQRTEYVEEEGRATQDGDQVKVDFVGKLDDVAFDGGTADDFVFQVGKGRMLAEFEEAVQGLKAGESKTFPLTFPEDYQAEHLAGKTAEFTVTVKAVMRPELPEVDADFARALGQAEGDVEKLMEEIRQNIEREVSARTSARSKDSVMNALLQAVTFDVPKALVQQEVAGRVQAAREELRSRGMPDVDKMPIPEELFEEEATRRVKLGLLLAALVEKAELQAKPEQVRAKIEAFAQNYEDPAEVVGYYLSDAERRAEIEAVVLEDNVVEHIMAQAKVTPKAVSFDEIMGTAQPEPETSEQDESEQA